MLTIIQGDLMEIKKMKNKTKIFLEYSNKTEINFDTIRAKDCNMKIFLKDGRIIFNDEIEHMTINAVENKEVDIKNSETFNKLVSELCKTDSYQESYADEDTPAEYEDDGAIHITRSGQRFVFNNGQGDDMFTNDDISHFVKVVDNAIKKVTA